MKEDKSLNKLPALMSLIFGFIAIFTLFMPMLATSGASVAGGDITGFSGLNVALGTPVRVDASAFLKEISGMLGEDNEITLPPYQQMYFSIKYFSFSPIVIIFPLVIAGTVCAVLDLTGIGGKKVPIIAAVCFTIAAVLFFVSKYMVILNSDMFKGIEDKAIVDKLISSFRHSLRYGVGALIGAVFSVICAVASFSSIFLEKQSVTIKIHI